MANSTGTEKTDKIQYFVTKLLKNVWTEDAFLKMISYICLSPKASVIFNGKNLGAFPLR
jgi:hypothetical protein